MEAKTIREAVIEATKWGTDYWTGELELDSKLRSACVRNSMSLNRWSETVTDKLTIEMATKYGRPFQI